MCTFVKKISLWDFDKSILMMHQNLIKWTRTTICNYYINHYFVLLSSYILYATVQIWNKYHSFPCNSVSVAETKKRICSVCYEILFILGWLGTINKVSPKLVWLSQRQTLFLALIKKLCTWTIFAIIFW